MAVTPKIANRASLLVILGLVPVPENLHFLSKFGGKGFKKKGDTEFFKWLCRVGDGGMAPIVDRSASAPVHKGGGVYEIYAKPAMVKEMFFISEDEYNILLSMTETEIRKLAVELDVKGRTEDHALRNFRTFEWLAAQTVFNAGYIQYRDREGRNFFIDYKTPTAHKNVLASDRKWKTGANQTPIEDIRSMVNRVKKYGKNVRVMINSDTVLSKIVGNEAIMEIMKSQNFGEGLAGKFIADPAGALGMLLGIPIEEYDESYPMIYELAHITDPEHWTFDTELHLEPGMTATIQKVNGDGEASEEYEAVVADVSNGQVTWENPIPAELAFMPGRTRITVEIPYLQNNRISVHAEQAQNKPLIEYWDAPHGIRPRVHGMRSTSRVLDNPDRIRVIVERLGLPIMYENRAVGYIDI